MQRSPHPAPAGWSSWCTFCLRSKPKLQVQQRVYDMMLYAYPALEQFPKSQKFSLAQDMKHCMDKIIRLVITANKKYTKKTTLQELDVEIAALQGPAKMLHRILVCFCRDFLPAVCTMELLCVFLLRLLGLPFSLIARCPGLTGHGSEQRDKRDLPPCRSKWSAKNKTFMNAALCPVTGGVHEAFVFCRPFKPAGKQVPFVSLL